MAGNEDRIVEEWQTVERLLDIVSIVAGKTCSYCSNVTPSILAESTLEATYGRPNVLRIGQSCLSTYWQRRIKIPLETWDIIDSVLEKPKRLLQATIPGTGKDGGPSCVTVKPIDG